MKQDTPLILMELVWINVQMDKIIVQLVMQTIQTVQHATQDTHLMLIELVWINVQMDKITVQLVIQPIQTVNI